MTRQQTKQKESKTGIMSIVINTVSNSVSSLVNNFTKRDEQEEDEMDVVIEEEVHEEMAEAKFESFLLSKKENEIVLRFHVVVGPEYTFDIKKDKVLLRGLKFGQDDPWSGGIEMDAKKKVQGLTLMVGHTKLPKAFKGKILNYKYFVCKGPERGVYEDLKADYLSGTINRSLKIPHNFAGEFFDQYDDVILMDNSKRKAFRKKATKAFLPSFKKIVKNGEYQSLQQNVKKFERVFSCHTNGILFVEDNGKRQPLHWERQQESLARYDLVCNEIASDWTNHLFDNLKEIQEKVRNCKEENKRREHLKSLVFGSMFYLLLQNAIHKNLPDASKENVEIIVSALSPMIHAGNCLKLETVSSILETPQKRESIAEAFEEGLNKITKYSHFQENPVQILKLLPLVHFLRGCDRPYPIKALKENNRSEYWGFFKISISVLKAFKSLKNSGLGAMSFYEEMKIYARIDPVLPYSYLRCLRFDEFISLLNDEEGAAFFDLSSIIATTLTWLHKDEIANINPDVLMSCQRNYVVQRLSSSRKNIKYMRKENILDLEIIAKDLFTQTIMSFKERNVPTILLCLDTIVSTFSFGIFL